MNEYFNPAGWPRPKGYSNAVSARGRMIFVAGQVGWNDKEEFETDDFVGQTRQSLSNIRACLEAAGATPDHMVRMTWYVVNKQEYLDALAQVGATYREVMGRTFPAMSLVEVAGLIEVGAKLEIEVTAVIPD